MAKSNKKSGKPSQGGAKHGIVSRVRTLYAVFILLGIAIAVRIAWIAFISPSVNHNAEVMSNGIYRTRTLEAHRGAILSSDGEPLAISSLRYDVYIDCKSDGVLNTPEERFLEECDSLSRMLARLFSPEDAQLHGYDYVPASDYYNRLVDGRREGTARDLSMAPRMVTIEERDMMQRTFPILNRSIGWVEIFEERDVRLYPSGDVARQIIGRYDSRIIGDREVDGTGLEGMFGDYLTGVDGQTREQWIAHGFWTNVSHSSNAMPVDGCNVVTTIDAGLQRLAHNRLTEALQHYEASFGVALVMEVETGNILTMVSLGSGAERGQNYTERVYNHALKTRMCPGSTMKLATAMALIELGGYDLDTEVNLEHSSPDKSVNVGAVNIKDSHDVAGANSDGNVTLLDAFAHSSNVYFAKAVYEKFSEHPEIYTRFLTGLGFNDYVGLEEYGEARGYFVEADNPEWHSTRGSTASRLPRLAYGYELEVPPIHMITLYNGVANDGRMVAPRLVDRIERDGEVVERMPVVALNERMCSDRTLALLDSCMAAASQRTGTKFRNLEIEFGCKTGTAQMWTNFVSSGHLDNQHMQNGLDTDDKFYYGSIVCTMPQDNPRYTILVGVCKQKTPQSSGYYGIDLAGPVASSIMEYIYDNDPSLHQQLEEAPTPYAPVNIKSGCSTAVATVGRTLSAMVVDERGDSEWCSASVDVGGNATLGDVEVAEGVVPDVRGMGLSDALYLLESLGMEVRHSGSGRVRTQSVTPGTALGSNNVTIEITLER